VCQLKHGKPENGQNKAAAGGFRADPLAEGRPFSAAFAFWPREKGRFYKQL